jgi:hypothetical protein
MSLGLTAVVYEERIMNEYRKVPDEQDMPDPG